MATALRCRVCGGPAFDCKCWQVHASAAEAERCEARLARGDLTPKARAIWERQLMAALRLHGEARAAVAARLPGGLFSEAEGGHCAFV